MKGMGYVLALITVANIMGGAWALGHGNFTGARAQAQASGGDGQGGAR